MYYRKLCAHTFSLHFLGSFFLLPICLTSHIFHIIFTHLLFINIFRLYSHSYLLGLSFLQIKGKYNLTVLPNSNQSHLDRVLVIDLNPVLLKPNMCMNHLGFLVKIQILIQEEEEKDCKSTFLTMSQVMCKLLVHEPHFEQEGFGQSHP